MYLNKKEEEMLNGEKGYAVRKAMEILVALGDIYGAERLIKVGSVQVAGVSYHNLGDAGLEFLNELAKDGKVKVLTTLNPAGMDLENWRQLGISEEFAQKQNLVIEAFEKTANLATAAAAIKGAGRYHIHTPIINMTKAQIILKGTDLGVDYSLTHSCYDPDSDGRSCGRCDSCRLRLKGFAEAGQKDRIEYPFSQDSFSLCKGKKKP